MGEDDFEERAEAAGEEFVSEPDNVGGVDFDDLVAIFIAGAHWARVNATEPQAK